MSRLKNLTDIDKIARVTTIHVRQGQSCLFSLYRSAYNALDSRRGKEHMLVELHLFQLARSVFLATICGPFVSRFNFAP